MENGNKKPEAKPEQKSPKEAVLASDILNSMKAELFDPDLAEKYQKAQEAAQTFFALYMEFQRAGFSKEEAYGLVRAMCGGK